MRNSVIKEITKYAGLNKKAFLITGDAGFGILDEFKAKFPSRFLNLGVAEQNMISFASGLSLCGYKVFIYNIIPFLMYRCYEQVRNDICYQELDITLIGIGSGVTYAPQGMTHYSIEDIAIARSLPNLTVLSPADPLEARKCAKFACKSEKPVYIRIAKSGEPLIHEYLKTPIGRPIIVQEGSGVAVLFHGSVSSEVMQAIKITKRLPMVISVPMIQPLDTNFLERKLKNIHTVITVEEHFVDGGLGSIVADWILLKKLPLKLKKLGIKNEFIHAIKNNTGMRKKYGISSYEIRRAIEDAFKHE